MNYEEYVERFNRRADVFSLDIDKDIDMRKSLIDQEDELWNEWSMTYSPEELKQFCFDGLLAGRNKDPKEEEKKWLNAKRRVLFFMKDTNGNPDDDIRSWHIGWETYEDGTIKPLHRFYIVLLKWLWALNEVTADHLPVFDKTKEEYIEATWQYPMAQVNGKKISGGAQVSNEVLWLYFERDTCSLARQFRLLNPNIIVCGGGSGTLCQYVMEYLYQNYFFEKINNWCYYCTSLDLLVIDSYHPSSRISDEEKFDAMIAAVQQFYKYKALKESLIQQ